MSEVDLFVDEPVTGWPWGQETGDVETKLNEALVSSLIAGPVEGHRDVDAALALLELVDNELRAYGTDSSQQLSEKQIAMALRALKAVSARVGVEIKIPFSNFGTFRSYWTRKGASGPGGWGARRAIVHELLTPAFEVLEQLALRPRHSPLPAQSLKDLKDPAAILEQLQRIQRAVVQDDPALAIGSAKELIESTAKVVLIERGEVVDGKADIQALIKKAQELLLLHPSQATVGPDGSDAVKKILGGATSIAVGVAELRNRGWGTGHGAAGRRVGLRPRHAHLAVNAAVTWCQLMLDTLQDPDAPWSQAQPKP
ncbi:abortive infection family protein [Pseudonocardia sp. WMMC193]|uniref:abortive infection family protein n=1 Tax=Pseudonocardia sp. WMMC193 TaxID=2911965 RepID=UPI001F468BCC|nr:abortive infection family protein [Pseudonocardia sp. WMMC193]MCF7547164.1 abortive infection family protein [Pseudonocardia sp. WMMC193]MCF7547258.1 abortive infection family protein [Pseudonocardia sp. WMMC193]